MALLLKESLPEEGSGQISPTPRDGDAVTHGIRELTLARERGFFGDDSHLAMLCSLPSAHTPCRGVLRSLFPRGSADMLPCILA